MTFQYLHFVQINFGPGSIDDRGGSGTLGGKTEERTTSDLGGNLELKFEGTASPGPIGPLY